MHRFPAGSVSGALRSALTRCSRRLAPDSGRLLMVAVLVVATGTVFALLPGSGQHGAAAGPARDTAATVLDAASHTAAVSAPAGGKGDQAKQDHARQNDDVHGGDWRRDHRGHGKNQQNQAPAAQTNANCSLIVPADPISAAGLATAYRLTATDPRQGACHEASADQSAFVEAAIFDHDAHTVSIYHPLVIDYNSSPAAAPVPVTLSPRSVVGVWFGFNGDTLTLTGPGAPACVNGLPGSPFGQFAYCNAPQFFAAANADPAFQAKVPAIGTTTLGRAKGQPCPTTRDFAVVDQDQSDNLATAYRIINGRMAQVTKATAGTGTPLTNGSDEGLVAKFIDPALGCTPFTAPDLTDDMVPTPALALNELSAAKFQRSPAALVPMSDPMVLVGGHTSGPKTDLYRAGVNQPSLAADAGQSPEQYCAAIALGAPARLTSNADLLGTATSPTTDFPNLLGFLVDRLATTMDNLKCAEAKAVAAAVGSLLPPTADATQAGGNGAATGAQPPVAPGAGTTPPGQPATSPSAGPSSTPPSATTGPTGTPGKGRPTGGGSTAAATTPPATPTGKPAAGGSVSPAAPSTAAASSTGAAASTGAAPSTGAPTSPPGH